MSGGSYNYAYLWVEDMADELGGDELRDAFAAHLKLVAKAMQDIEWVESGDYGAGDGREAILAVLK